MKSFLKILASIVLMGGFLWAAFRNVDWTLLTSAFETATPIWLILSGIIVILSCIPRAWRWCLLLKPIAPEVSLRSAFWAVLVAYAGNAVFPRAGEVARALALEKDHPVGVSAILATVVIERLLDVLALLIIFGVVLFFAREQIGAAFPGLEQVALLSLPIIICALVSLGLLSAYGERGLSFVERTIAYVSPTLASKITDLLRSFIKGMSAINTVEGYAGIIVSTVILNAFYFLATFLPLYSFNLPQQYDLGLFEALVIMAIATVGIVIPTPGGTGTYHFFCAQALHLFYHVPEALALAFATSVHAVTFFTFILLGGPSLVRLMWHSKKEKKALK